VTQQKQALDICTTIHKRHTTLSGGTTLDGRGYFYSAIAVGAFTFLFLNHPKCRSFAALFERFSWNRDQYTVVRDPKSDLVCSSNSGVKAFSSQRTVG